MALIQLGDLTRKTAVAPSGPAANLSAGASKLVVTPSAVERVKVMLSERPELSGKALRVYVTSGGCAGYQYGMSFDERQADDTVMDFDGLSVLVDSDSVNWLGGAQVDYLDSLMGSGFSITNPSAEASCGCGHSFSKPNEPAPADTGSCR